MLPSPDYSGMTVNERLFNAGTLDAFDDAVRLGDREPAIDLPVAVHVETPESSVDDSGRSDEKRASAAAPPPPKSLLFQLVIPRLVRGTHEHGKG